MGWKSTVLKSGAHSLYSLAFFSTVITSATAKNYKGFKKKQTQNTKQNMYTQTYSPYPAFTLALVAHISRQYYKSKTEFLEQDPS